MKSAMLMGTVILGFGLCHPQLPSDQGQRAARRRSQINWYCPTAALPPRIMGPQRLQYCDRGTSIPAEQDSQGHPSIKG